VPFVAAHFNELDSSSTLTSPSCHSARRACPELQNPLFQKAKEKLYPGEKVPVRADEGWGKVFFYGPHPPSTTVPPHPEGEGYFLVDRFCDFAFSSAQNDRVGGILRRVKVFGLEKPTERKSGAMCISYGLMLCVLVWIDAV